MKSKQIRATALAVFSIATTVGGVLAIGAVLRSVERASVAARTTPAVDLAALRSADYDRLRATLELAHQRFPGQSFTGVWTGGQASSERAESLAEAFSSAPLSANDARALIDNAIAGEFHADAVALEVRFDFRSWDDWHHEATLESPALMHELIDAMGADHLSNPSLVTTWTVAGPTCAKIIDGAEVHLLNAEAVGMPLSWAFPQLIKTDFILGPGEATMWSTTAMQDWGWRLRASVSGADPEVTWEVRLGILRECGRRWMLEYRHEDGTLDDATYLFPGDGLDDGIALYIGAAREDGTRRIDYLDIESVTSLEPRPVPSGFDLPPYRLELDARDEAADGSRIVFPVWVGPSEMAGAEVFDEAVSLVTPFLMEALGSDNRRFDFDSDGVVTAHDLDWLKRVRGGVPTEFE